MHTEYQADWFFYMVKINITKKFNEDGKQLVAREPMKQSLRFILLFKSPVFRKHILNSKNQAFLKKRRHVPVISIACI